MNFRFYIDPEIEELHIYRHGVTEHEVADVIENPGEDRSGSEGARVAVGQTKAGRYLRVIYVPEPGGAFIITGYELKGKPLMAYQRRLRRKGKR